MGNCNSHCASLVGPVAPAVSLQAVANSPFFAHPSSPPISPTCMYPKHEVLDDVSSDVTLHALGFPGCAASSKHVCNCAPMHEHAAAALLAVEGLQGAYVNEKASTIDAADTGILRVWHGKKGGVSGLVADSVL